jgi:hypothetical protein
LYLNVVTCYFATRKATIHEDERWHQLELTYDFMDSFSGTKVPEENHQFHNQRLCLVNSSL